MSGEPAETIDYAECLRRLTINEKIAKYLKRRGEFPEPVCYETRDGDPHGRWEPAAIEALRIRLDRDMPIDEPPSPPPQAEDEEPPVRGMLYVAKDIADALGIPRSDFDALRAAGRFPAPTHRAEGYTGELEPAWDFGGDFWVQRAVLPARQHAAPQAKTATTKQTAPKTSKPRQAAPATIAPAIGRSRFDPRRD